jgi:hypothetical protein
MNLIMTATTALTGLSVVLLVILLIVYFRNLRQVKSKLLVGLIIFSLIFLAQNIFSLYYSLTMMEYYVPAVEFQIFIFSLLQTIAFAIMLWITWE